MRPWTGGAFEQLVPLIPDLDRFAVRIQRVEAVLPDPPLDRTQHVDANRSGISEEAGRHGIGQTVFAALSHKDPVGRLGEYSGVPTEGKAWLRERLMSAPQHIVRTRPDCSGDPRLLRLRIHLLF